MISLVDVLDLGRFQFAMTTVFHFFFVPMSIGLALIVALMETYYVRTKNEKYKTMTKFWGKILLLSFAVGVVTGIIQEFQFGMNWSRYSRYVGDIFGAPLAVEALVAFFAESTFLGLWMFTWDKVKPSVHALFVWLVALGSACSALWILAANSFMQNPVGFTIAANGKRAELTSFTAVLLNKQLWIEFPHVITATFITGGFVVIGMSAFKLLKLKKDNPQTNLFRSSIRFGTVIAIIGVAGAIITGDRHALDLETSQPMKFAAMEGVDKTLNPTNNPKVQQPWSLISITDPDTHEVIAKVEIPYVLSILGHHTLTGGRTVGTTELNEQFEKKYGHLDGIKNYYVPENTVFYAFRIMALGSGLLGLVAVVAAFLNRAKTDAILKQRWLLWILGICTFIPFIMNTSGWLVTELGRYPWIVYGLMTIADAISPNVSVTSLLITNTLYFLTFTVLGGIMIWASAQVLKKGMLDNDNPITDEEKVKQIDPFEKEELV